jgi:UDP-glucose 4-epimerase
MEVAVTGWGGFIGSRLVARLLSDGYNVRLFEGDVSNERDVRGAMRGCDLVYHLAAVSDVREAEKDPTRAIMTNAWGTYLVAQRAAEVGARLIFTSSSAVYGDGKVPATEDQKCDPISVYGATKRIAEMILELLSWNGLDVCVVRMGNVVGPGMKSGVIYDLLQNARGQYPIEVYGNGEQRKAFLWLDDAIDGLLLVAHRMPAGYTVFNMGGLLWVSVKELVEMVIPGLPVQYLSSEPKGWPGDVSWEWVDSFALTAEGWKLTMTSRQAILETARMIKEEL